MEAMRFRHRIHESAEREAGPRSAALCAPWTVLLAVVCLISACATPPETVTLPGDAGPPSSVNLLPPSQRPYTINGETYYPLPSASGYMETGKASWYGHPFHGRRTSSGETYDMYKVSAAHKVLPLGTYVLVENLGNGKNIVLRINDRGPFVKGRIIDLSYAAASAIDVVGPGVADVRVTALAKEVGRAHPRTGISEPVLESKDFSRGGFHRSGGCIQRQRECCASCRTAAGIVRQGGCRSFGSPGSRDALPGARFPGPITLRSTGDRTSARIARLRGGLRHRSVAASLILFRSTPEVLKTITLRALS